jgi:hypothetical protein
MKIGIIVVLIPIATPTSKRPANKHEYYTTTVKHKPIIVNKSLKINIHLLGYLLSKLQSNAPIIAPIGTMDVIKAVVESERLNSIWIMS